MFKAASLTTFPNATLNSRQANASPCRIPFLILMGAENLFWILTRHWVLFIVVLIKAISFVVCSALRWLHIGDSCLYCHMPL